MRKTHSSPKEKARAAFEKALRFIRRRYKGILYYSAVALVLALVASAAESYRADREGSQALILPENIAEEAVSEAAVSIIYPENMRLIRPFSCLPEWNGEMKQWEVHAANDYAVSDGCVRCLEGGTVRDVGESGVKGGYVEIEAGGGTVYIYSSLQPGEDMCPGYEAAAGDIIGIADDSLPSESTAGSHLHLEVYKAGVLSDFEQICGKNGPMAD